MDTELVYLIMCVKFKKKKKNGNGVDHILKLEKFRKYMAGDIYCLLSIGEEIAITIYIYTNMLLISQILNGCHTKKPCYLSKIIFFSGGHLSIKIFLA